jgi:hypothetical protein
MIFTTMMTQVKSVRGRPPLKDSEIVSDVGKCSGLPSNLLDEEGKVSLLAMKLAVQWHNRGKRYASSCAPASSRTACALL